jgi:hypothetical protein
VPPSRGKLDYDRLAHPFLGRRWRFGAGGGSATSTAPESSGPPAASGSGGAGLRPAGAGAGQGRVSSDLEETADGEAGAGRAER